MSVTEVLDSYLEEVVELDGFRMDISKVEEMTTFSTIWVAHVVMNNVDCPIFANVVYLHEVMRYVLHQFFKA